MTSNLPIQAGSSDIRPWYREPWVWVIIAFPSAAIVGCVVTVWLAISHPDFLVVDDTQYQQIKSGMNAQPERQSITRDHDNSDSDGEH